VDEAQDTNRDQWRVVEALSSEFFSGEGAREAQRTLFAVGDAKQSIFSFQRADPKEFIAARDRVFAKARDADRPAKNVPLNLSFRSGEAVLSLVDAVFDDEAAAAAGLTPDGEHVAHEYIRQGQAGLVELWPLETPRTTEDEDTPEWALPLTQESVDDAQQRTAWRIARRVQTMLQQGEMLQSRGRPIEAGDILVLVRRRTGFVDHLVRAFKYIGVPVAGRDRMVLTDELPVMDLLALARFAVLPSDDLNLATVLKGPFVGMNEEALLALAHGRKGTLWQALLRRKQEENFSVAAHDLSALASSVDVKTPFEFFSHVLTNKGGRQRLVARLGEEIHDPVDELLEEALRFELTASASMQAFLHGVDTGNLQIKRDLEAAGGNVRIMTVHSAKGLQAPIVFLSDLVGLPNVGRDTRILPIDSSVPDAPALPLWTSPGKGLEFIDGLKDAVKARQLSEYRRLLYVALTRAEDRLYVAGWRGKDEPSGDCWYTAVAEGFERLGATETPLGAERTALRFEVAQTVQPPAPAPQTEKQAPAAPPSWLTRLMPEEPTPAKPLAPSRPEEEPAVSSPLARTDARQDGIVRYGRGRLIHALLEWLPNLALDKRETAALRFLERNAPDLTAGVRSALWQEVNRLLEDVSFGALFGPSSRAEVPIAGIVSGRAISGQVDRLVVTEDEVLVVDFKTNRPPPAEVHAVAPVYLRQMGLYVRALEGVYPNKSVRAALLWTDAAFLMEVPKALMEEALTHSGM
ncbi:MAG: UvrD-helicase domain-containing protein, partial [Kordiimonadaceae bacterium]|nr:UvrD-helicase domain-containing protein [Kordiimonadaceae bacterium]